MHNNLLVLSEINSASSKAIRRRYYHDTINVNIGSKVPERLLWEVSFMVSNLRIIGDLDVSTSLEQIRVIRNVYLDLPIYIYGSLNTNRLLQEVSVLGIDGMIFIENGYGNLFQFLETEVFQKKDQLPTLEVETSADSPEQIRTEDPYEIQSPYSYSFSEPLHSTPSNALASDISGNIGNRFWALKVPKGSDYIFVVKEIYKMAIIPFKRVLYPQLEPASHSDDAIFCFLPGFCKPDADLLNGASFFVYVYYENDRPTFEGFAKPVIDLELESFQKRTVDKVKYFLSFLKVVGSTNLMRIDGVRLSEDVIQHLLISKGIRDFSELWEWMYLLYQDPESLKIGCDLSFEELWGRVYEKLSDQYIELIKEFSGVKPSIETLRVLGYINRDWLKNNLNPDA